MEKIPTAEEFYKNYPMKVLTKGRIHEMLCEFAKLHVEAALKAAVDKAILGKQGAFGTYWNRGDLVLDEESILTAYPLNNIK
jgi:hypothetical protein